MQAPQEVYTRLLMHRDPSRGFPLYTPEPNEGLPPDYRACGPRIGDLGYIDNMNGGFNFLFNLCLPADHPFNQVYGVPETFQQLKLRVGEERDHEEDVQFRPNQDPPGIILATCPTKVIQQGGMVDAQNFTSTMGAGFTMQFNSSKNEGAMLVLPHGTEKHDLLPIKKLERAVKENAQSWHDFIHRYQFVSADLGRHVDNNSLFVVTGYHKASSWCLASFSREPGTVELSYHSSSRIAH
ncbi:hypothetical protein L210DRAFT_996824 [Boletus edulis BED1]|uniref:Uncharacterized protein n=1 Tax=Boletus edulis BED1 TaxID=1328754 RepID=A0AAD4BKU9_BOLED|nr:hypothetical protein L210DRAFT_996824 [Boletus edulis BED1]